MRFRKPRRPGHTPASPRPPVRGWILLLLMMGGWVGLAAPLPAQAPDTLRLSFDEALARLATESPTLEGARLRAEGSRAGLRQARVRPNPQLSFQAENLGGREETSGRPGWDGTHGTLLVTVPFEPRGGRARRIEVARGELTLADADLGRAWVEQAGAMAMTATRLQAARGRLDVALAEAEAMEEWVRTLDLQAGEGRASLGDAARARLERTRTRAGVVRRRTEVSREEGVLATHLGMDPDVPIEVVLPDRCVADHPPSDKGPADPLGPVEASLRIAEAREHQARAERVPLLLPAVGWRREAGRNLLTLGMGLEVPIFDRRRGGLEEARARSRAAAADLRAARSNWTSARARTKDRITALQALHDEFDPDWWDALDLTVSAAEAAFREGEGTLEATLQARRARADALSELEDWRADLRTARIELDLLEGRPPDARSLCNDSIVEDRR